MKMIKKILITVCCLFSLNSSSLFAKTQIPYKLQPSQNIQLSSGVEQIPIYEIYGRYYVAVSDLKYVGCHVYYDTSTGQLGIQPVGAASTLRDKSVSNLNSNQLSIYSKPVTIGNFKIQSLVSGGHVLVPVEALDAIGNILITDKDVAFTLGGTYPVQISDSSVYNLSSENLTVELVNTYWLNDKVDYVEETFILKPKEIIKRNTLETDKTYIATIPTHLKGESYEITFPNYLGQVNEELLRIFYTKGLSTDYGDKVTLDEVQCAESLVNKKGLSSDTKYLIWTTTDKQKTYIFEGEQGEWKLYKMFICSTGKVSTPTPAGTYKLTRKVPSFGQNKGYCCKYAFGFIGTSYLYHSIIFDKTGTYLLEGKGVLGKKASDGCIRFSEEHAKWFYDNMKSGTTVYIN